jgi:hypothetical protein
LNNLVHIEREPCDTEVLVREETMAINWAERAWNVSARSKRLGV